jgi:hypothetical protein
MVGPLPKVDGQCKAWPSSSCVDASLLATFMLVQQQKDILEVFEIIT